MQLINKEIVLKIRQLPPDKRTQVIDGMAKLLAGRACRHFNELPANEQIDGGDWPHPR